MKSIGITIALLCAIVMIVSLISFALVFFLHPDSGNSSVTIRPEVTVTNNTYNLSSIFHTFGETSIHEKFKQEYGSKYSDKLRNNIVMNIKEQVSILGENATELEECLRATGKLDENKIKIMPCLTEKAKFEYYLDCRGKDFYISGYGLPDYYKYNSTTNRTSIVSEECWIFVFNWGYEHSFGHIKIYVIAIRDYSVLCYFTCC